MHASKNLLPDWWRRQAFTGCLLISSETQLVDQKCSQLVNEQRQGNTSEVLAHHPNIFVDSLHQIYICASTVRGTAILNRYSNPAFSSLATWSSKFDLWPPHYATLTLVSLMLRKHLILMGTMNLLFLAGCSTFSKEALIDVCAPVKIDKISPLGDLSWHWPSNASWTNEARVKLILYSILTHAHTHTH